MTQEMEKSREKDLLDLIEDLTLAFHGATGWQIGPELWVDIITRVLAWANEKQES